MTKTKALLSLLAGPGLEAELAAPRMATCPLCGTEFERPRGERPSPYCSTPCRRTAYAKAQWQAEKARKARWQAEKARKAKWRAEGGQL